MSMRKTLLALAAAALLLPSCDDGRIYPEELVIAKEGFTLKMTGEITGMDTWTSRYSLALAGFKDGSEYASVSVPVPTSYNDAGEVAVTLSGLKSDIDEVELCVIDLLRQRVIAYKTIEREDFTLTGDTLFMPVGKVDVSMYKAIQTSVFDAKCISCHGANGGAPRGLFLTEGKSHDALVGVQSKAVPEYKLVEPGKAAESLLPLILEENGHLHHDHADILEARNKDTQVSLIRNWIRNGAKER